MICVSLSVDLMCLLQSGGDMFTALTDGCLLVLSFGRQILFSVVGGGAKTKSVKKTGT